MMLEELGLVAPTSTPWVVGAGACAGFALGAVVGVGVWRAGLVGVGSASPAVVAAAALGGVGLAGAAAAQALPPRQVALRVAAVLGSLALLWGSWVLR